MINNEGKEMINDYAVKNEVFVGNRRYLFAVHTDEKEPQRFLKCQCYDDELFRHYVNAVTSNDFVECMKLYLADISAAVEKVEKDRAAIGLEDISCLKGSDLLSASRDTNLRDPSQELSKPIGDMMVGGSNTGEQWASKKLNPGWNSTITMDGGGGSTDPTKDIEHPEYFVADLYLNNEKVANIDLTLQKGEAE